MVWNLELLEILEASLLQTLPVLVYFQAEAKALTLLATTGRRTFVTPFHNDFWAITGINAIIQGPM